MQRFNTGVELNEEYIKAVERTVELERLITRARERKHLLVFGPEGVGKTRLLQEFARIEPLALYVPQSKSPHDLLLSLVDTLRAKLGRTQPSFQYRVHEHRRAEGNGRQGIECEAVPARRRSCAIAVSRGGEDRQGTRILRSHPDLPRRALIPHGGCRGFASPFLRQKRAAGDDELAAGCRARICAPRGGARGSFAPATWMPHCNRSCS